MLSERDIPPPLWQAWGEPNMADEWHRDASGERISTLWLVGQRRYAISRRDKLNERSEKASLVVLYLSPSMIQSSVVNRRET